MHGAAGTLLPELLAGGRLRVVPLRTSRDPLFGGVHPEPIGENLAAAAALVREQALDLAVAQDGDADRLGVLDASGPLRVAAPDPGAPAAPRLPRRGARGGIAKTFSTSFQIDRIAKSLGVPLIETGIGFKYVAELMNRGEAVAGGEESGGYAFAFHLPERDGVLSALLLLESLALSGQTLGQALDALAAEFGRFEYGRRDVRLPVDLDPPLPGRGRQRPSALRRRAKPSRRSSTGTASSTSSANAAGFCIASRAPSPWSASTASTRTERRCGRSSTRPKSACGAS